MNPNDIVDKLIESDDFDVREYFMAQPVWTELGFKQRGRDWVYRQFLGSSTYRLILAEKGDEVMIKAYKDGVTQSVGVYDRFFVDQNLPEIRDEFDKQKKLLPDFAQFVEKFRSRLAKELERWQKQRQVKESDDFDARDYLLNPPKQMFNRGEPVLAYIHDMGYRKGTIVEYPYGGHEGFAFVDFDDPPADQNGQAFPVDELTKISMGESGDFDPREYLLSTPTKLQSLGFKRTHSGGDYEMYQFEWPPENQRSSRQYYYLVLQDLGTSYKLALNHSGPGGYSHVRSAAGLDPEEFNEHAEELIELIKQLYATYPQEPVNVGKGMMGWITTHLPKVVESEDFDAREYLLNEPKSDIERFLEVSPAKRATVTMASPDTYNLEVRREDDQTQLFGPFRRDEIRAFNRGSGLFMYCAWAAGPDVLDRDKLFSIFDSEDFDAREYVLDQPKADERELITYLEANGFKHIDGQLWEKDTTMVFKLSVDGKSRGEWCWSVRDTGDLYIASAHEILQMLQNEPEKRDVQEAEDFDARGYLLSTPRNEFSYEVIRLNAGTYFVAILIGGQPFKHLDGQVQTFSSESEAEETGKYWVKLYTKLDRLLPYDPTVFSTVLEWYREAYSRNDVAESEDFDARDYLLNPPPIKPFGYVLRYSSLIQGHPTRTPWLNARASRFEPHLGSATVFKRVRTTKQWPHLEAVPVYSDPRKTGDNALDPYYQPKVTEAKEPPDDFDAREYMLSEPEGPCLIELSGDWPEYWHPALGWVGKGVAMQYPTAKAAEQEVNRVAGLLGADWKYGVDVVLVSESLADDIAKEAEKAEAPKSEEQAEAGNYPKGHVHLNGFDIGIENAKGSTRSGENDKGEKWSVTMPAHYGYLKGTVGKDKDHLDVYIGDHPSSLLVFVVNQQKEGGGFDEHKVMMGFKSKDEAIATYDKAFSGDLGPKLRESVLSVTVDAFKDWVKSGDTKKPFKPIKGSSRVESIVDVLLDSKDHDKEWIGVDLDGTLAKYTGWKGSEHIGEPIPDMMARVKRWVRDGKKVKIFTARANDEKSVNAIKAWCKEHDLPDLEVTNLKDEHMKVCYDDRAVQVVKNTGEVVEAEDFDAREYLLARPTSPVIAFLFQQGFLLTAPDMWVHEDDRRRITAKCKDQPHGDVWRIELNWADGKEDATAMAGRQISDPEDSPSERYVIRELKKMLKARKALMPVAEAEEALPAPTEGDFDAREYLLNPTLIGPKAGAVYLGKEIWSDDAKLKKAFSWLTRIGAAPKFGTTSIHNYQQEQCAALDALELAAKNKGMDLDYVRFKNGRVLCYDSGKWAPIAQIMYGRILPESQEEFDAREYLLSTPNVVDTLKAMSYEISPDGAAKVFRQQDREFMLFVTLRGGQSLSYGHETSIYDLGIYKGGGRDWNLLKHIYSIKPEDIHTTLEEVENAIRKGEWGRVDLIINRVLDSKEESLLGEAEDFDVREYFLHDALESACRQSGMEKISWCWYLEVSPWIVYVEPYKGMDYVKFEVAFNVRDNQQSVFKGKFDRKSVEEKLPAAIELVRNDTTGPVRKFDDDAMQRMFVALQAIFKDANPAVVESEDFDPREYILQRVPDEQELEMRGAVNKGGVWTMKNRDGITITLIHADPMWNMVLRDAHGHQIHRWSGYLSHLLLIAELYIWSPVRESEDFDAREYLLAGTNASFFVDGVKAKYKDVTLRVLTANSADLTFNDHNPVYSSDEYNEISPLQARAAWMAVKSLAREYFGRTFSVYDFIGDHAYKDKDYAFKLMDPEEPFGPVGVYEADSSELPEPPSSDFDAREYFLGTSTVHFKVDGKLMAWNWADGEEGDFRPYPNTMVKLKKLGLMGELWDIYVAVNTPWKYGDGYKSLTNVKCRSERMLRKRIEAGFAAAKAWYEQNKYGLELWDVYSVLKTYPDWLDYCKQHKGERTGRFSEITADDYAFYRDLISRFAALHDTTYEALQARAPRGVQESVDDILADSDLASTRDYLLADPGPGNSDFEKWLEENLLFDKISANTWKLRTWFGKLIVKRHGEDCYLYTIYDEELRKVFSKIMPVEALAQKIQSDLSPEGKEVDYDGPYTRRLESEEGLDFSSYFGWDTSKYLKDQGYDYEKRHEHDAGMYKKAYSVGPITATSYIFDNSVDNPDEPKAHALLWAYGDKSPTSKVISVQFPITLVPEYVNKLVGLLHTLQAFEWDDSELFKTHFLAKWTTLEESEESEFNWQNFLMPDLDKYLTDQGYKHDGSHYFKDYDLGQIMTRINIFYHQFDFVYGCVTAYDKRNFFVGTQTLVDQKMTVDQAVDFVNKTVGELHQAKAIEWDNFDSFKNHFLSQWTPLEEAENFDAREYFLAPEDPEITLREMGFKSLATKADHSSWERYEGGTIKIVVDRYGYGTDPTVDWFITGYIKDEYSDEWNQKQTACWYPVERPQTLREVIDEVDANCRGVYESEDFDAREYLLSGSTVKLALGDVVDELKKWYDSVEVFEVDAIARRGEEPGSRYRLRCKRTRQLPDEYRALGRPYHERVLPSSFKANIRITIGRLVNLQGCNVYDFDFQGQAFKNVLIAFTLKQHED